MEHNKKNQFDKKDSLEMGNKAEGTFVEIAQNMGYSVEQASANEDMNEHWDYKISKNDDSIFKIDVKAQKRISRSDNYVQDEWIWIEMQGVKDNGWLYGGKSDLIAFERKTDFVIVKTDDLKKLVPTKLQRNPNFNPDIHKNKEKYIWVENSTEAKYRLYNRKGRKDIITLINFTDLESIIWQIWQK